VGTPDYLSQDLQRYRTATAESVKSFASRELQAASRVVIEGVPGQQKLAAEPPKAPAPKVPAGTGTESVNADEAFRSQPPKPGPTPAIRVPVPASFTLPNGLTVILSERTNLPIVSMALVVKTGSDANPPAGPGLANFTAAMLDQGTATRNALKLADDAAQIGTAIGTTSSMDSSRVQIRSLKKNAAAALDLIADVALHPSFPAEEIERQRGQRLTQLVERRGDPSGIASTVMAAALYGFKHPYGFTELGTEAGVKSVTRDEMAAFWKQNFVPNNAALVVAGAIDAASLRALVEKAFAGWTSGAPAKPALASPETTSAKVTVVDLPGAPQTQLRVAAVGAPRSTPDYASLEVMDMILGGLFSSRINQNLRQDHGYTYGAFSVFQYRKGPGPFYVTTGVRTDVTGPAVEEILHEVARIQAAPVTADELSLGRDALVRSLPGYFETTQSAVATIAGTYVYDLGLDYYTRYPGQINGVTAAGVQDVAKRYLVPTKFVVIAVGDRAKIGPQLQKLNLGGMELRDADGKLSKK
jgi:zinc protease